MNLERKVGKSVLRVILSCILAYGSIAMAQSHLYWGLQTDRGVYFSGETIWIKISARLPQENRQFPVSFPVKLQLLDETGKRVDGKVLQLRNGYAAGKMEIPDAALKGTYFVTAVPGWAGVQEEADFAYSSLTIIQPEEAPPFTGTIFDTAFGKKDVPGDRFTIMIDPGKEEFSLREEIVLQIHPGRQYAGPGPYKYGVSVAKKGSESTPVWRIVETTVGKDEIESQEYSVVSGRLVPERPDSQRSNISVLLSIPARAYIQRTHTNTDGVFSFRVKGITGCQEIYLIIGEEKDEVGIISDPQFRPASWNPPHDHIRKDSFDLDFLNNMYVAHQVRKIYGSPGSEIPKAEGDPVPFYTMPDQTIQLSEFVNLPNMEEVFREIVRDVIVLGTTRTRRLQVVDLVTNRTLGPHPCILMDGLPVLDQETVFEWPPELVDRIHLLNSKYLMGSWIMDGIIDIRTKNPPVNPERLKANILSGTYCFPENPEPFLPVTHSDPDSLAWFTPDFRNTLYWNPEVDAGEEGGAAVRFFTSDEPGEFVITVWAVSSTGISGYGRRVIQVKTVPQTF